MSLRLAVARDAGFDETIATQIDDYERSGLPEKAKAALRLADAWLSSPGDISDKLLAQLRQHLTRGEVLDLVLNLAKNSRNKMYVAFGMEPTVNAERLTYINHDPVTGKITTVDEKDNFSL